MFLNLKNNFGKTAIAVIFILFATTSFAQQQPDLFFNFEIENPRFTDKNAPIIYIDGSNNNLHQLEGGFAPFAKLANLDGYETRALTSYRDLKAADIFVVANPINEQNRGNWQRPIYSEFDAKEIDTITTWVRAGGNLLLIADHMPFAGAANELANAFGFDFCDGFAQLSEQENRRDVFSIANKRLTFSPLTDGTMGEKVNKIISFTGSAFTIPEGAIGVMPFQKTDRCLVPETAWQFVEGTDTTYLQDYYQGALLEFGKGKIAVFGEAAMFTAQIYKQDDQTFRFGFTAQGAEQNVEFVRNMLFWLAGNESFISSVEKEILQVNREMEAAFRKREYASVAQFYTEDAIVVGNNTEVAGREKLTDYWKQFGGATKWELTNISIESIGEGYALQRGYSNIYYNNQKGEEQVSSVIFSLIWRKTAEGWRIALDHYSAWGNE